MSSDVGGLAAALIRCPSVTPADAGAQGVLADALGGLGFQVERLTFGEAPDAPVDNLFAWVGAGPPRFAFAGHTDVVPPGDPAGWSVPPFAGAVDGGVLLGRGAADMKGALAAMVGAAAAHVARDAPGTLMFIVTGDEEGPATFGTAPLLAWMEREGHVPDLCLVGEPTSVRGLGDTIKIGRRGSLNATITVHGAQGHVAYPARADNPIPTLVAILAELTGRRFDDGHDGFDATNLEVTDLHVGNPAANVIPARAAARLNIRFNDRQRGAELVGWIEDVARRHAAGARVEARVSGEAFLTEPGPLSALVSAAVAEVTGVTPELSTSGGTSDARFIRRLCPVVEFGLVGASMHQVDEQVPLADLDALTRVYDAVLRRVFSR